MNEQQARKHIDNLKGYYAHLGAFIGTNLFLLAINLVNWGGELWVIYPLMGWGIGLAVHTVNVFFSGSDWEDRKMQELTGWTTTREELERLSERTRNLITILSSVDWQKIDPELLATRENLESVQEQIIGLKSGDQAGKREVVEQIEKLEAFVTSSKFDYYDKAAE